MKKVTLTFPSILDMLEFESTVFTYGHQKDHLLFTVKGFFDEAQIELAKSGYRAIVLEELSE